MDHRACGISIIKDSKSPAMIRPPRRNFSFEKKEGMSGTKGRIVDSFDNARGVTFVFPITGTFKAVGKNALNL